MNESRPDWLNDLAKKVYYDLQNSFSELDESDSEQLYQEQIRIINELILNRLMMLGGIND